MLQITVSITQIVNIVNKYFQIDKMVWSCYRTFSNQNAQAIPYNFRLWIMKAWVNVRGGCCYRFCLLRSLASHGTMQGIN